MKVILYKIDNKSKIREWTIEVDGGKYRTHYGEKNGKIVTTEWTASTIKNIGKSNETTVEQQAILEAEAIVKKQREKGYSESPTKKTGDVMLAKSFEDYSSKIRFPVYSQPKLDGIRCYITQDGMFTRNHKPIVSCPHIWNELLAPLMDKNFRVDGELYNPTLKDDFNKICSLVKKTKPSKDDLEESKRIIQFWCYDICDSSKIFSERLELRNKYLENYQYTKLLDTHYITSQKQLDEHYEKYLNDGNEGQMVRLDDIYEEKRSKFLLKRKEFQDDEFVIEDILEGTGNRSGKAGAIVTKTKDGVEFNSNIKLDWASLEDLLKNKKRYIGTICTIKYFNLTPDKKVPRFPYVVKLHGNEKV